MGSVVSRAPASTDSLSSGVIGGLAGGVVFGMLMQMMGMVSMVAMLVGSESVAVGWFVHLAISAFIGATFALLFGAKVASLGSGAGFGVVYGLIWWVLGALALMPARLGMELFMVNEMTMQSLMGHALYGLILGLVFALVRPRLGRG